ncbi:hypothetical protein QJS04_geneDACA009901 [Acorus gramineus]|uniref:Queuine tRNA-ribosyltransferase accessory subunit 2 n=1 Tax=Acorus gramineus TaxID=55184 RepID=A0AAV9BKB5_ACOGR|nr:hypothetical protein QJS04_geneDACA009901 [Acorus gramineus]
MRFIVSARCGRARAGVLHAMDGGGRYPVETPSLLLTTRKGLPAFVPRDHLLSSSLPFLPDSRLLHVSPLHFIECPSPKTISKIGGLHRMLGLQGYFFIASPRDSILCLSESDGTNKLGASFETPCGRRLVKPAEYMCMISSLKPDMWASLADEVPSWVCDKRNKTSVDRTVRWLDECIDLDTEVGKNMLGAIVGGSSVEERKRCATEVARRNVSGYWIGGFGLGENFEERPALLSAVTVRPGKRTLDNLPEEKPRHVTGLGLPEEVLDGIAAGIDLFDSTCVDSSDGAKINLRATIYRKDTSPIANNCSCYTCLNHTRAYINHLLNVHEMLAQTLLEIHNTHHYMGFFRSIREAIKAGEFDEFYQRFIDNRRGNLTLAAMSL